MNTSLLAATSAFLFLAPFAGSAGLRAGLLTVAGILLLVRWRELLALAATLPRAFIAAFLAWSALAVASIGWSASPKYSLGEVHSEILYPAMALSIFYAAGALVPARSRIWWRALLIGSLATFVGLCLQQWLGITVSRHSVLEQRGPWSTHLVLVAPLLLALGWPQPWGENRASWVQALAIAVLLLAAWLTENRMIWVAFGVQLVLAMALWPAMPTAHTTRMRELRRLTITAAVVVGLAFAGALVERNERFFGDQAPVTASFERDLRPRMWAKGIEVWGEAPLIGHGFGREIAAARFIPLTPRVADHPEMRHAHNTFIDAGVSLGVAGVAVLVALLLLLGREYVRYLRRPEVAPLGILGLTLLAGFLTKNLTDDFMYRHNALVFWALNGMLLGFGHATRARREG